MPLRAEPAPFEPHKQWQRVTAPAAMGARFLLPRLNAAGGRLVIILRRGAGRGGHPKPCLQAERVGVFGAAKTAMTAEHLLRELAPAPSAAIWGLAGHSYQNLRRFPARRLARGSGKIQGRSRYHTYRLRSGDRMPA